MRSRSGDPTTEDLHARTAHPKVCVCVCKGETNDTTKEGVVTVANECAVALLFDPLWLMFLVLGDSYGIGGSYTKQHRARPRKSCLGGAACLVLEIQTVCFCAAVRVPMCVWCTRSSSRDTRGRCSHQEGLTSGGRGAVRLNRLLFLV